ncbi:hypothetical protein [Methylopila sp. M107]|uniref:hypothetical protein n=1 Tax=Methylopila sp. M107 TaxID=1101190 RepID=UPI00036CB268|nr:hypothetical protein [Methylopila sp. M107]
MMRALAAIGLWSLVLATPAAAFSFDDWVKVEDPPGVLTFDCTNYSKCGLGSRVTLAGAQDGPMMNVGEYQALHEKIAKAKSAETGAPITIGQAKLRSVGGFDVVEIERKAVLGPGSLGTHHFVNAMLHRAGKRRQIICSANDKAMARRNFEGMLNGAIKHLTRNER